MGTFSVYAKIDIQSTPHIEVFCVVQEHSNYCKEKVNIHRNKITYKHTFVVNRRCNNICIMYFHPKLHYIHPLLLSGVWSISSYIHTQKKTDKRG